MPQNATLCWFADRQRVVPVTQQPLAQLLQLGAAAAVAWGAMALPNSAAAAPAPSARSAPRRDTPFAIARATSSNQCSMARLQMNSDGISELAPC